MIKLVGSEKIILTGAGGWLGSEYLEFLSSHYGDEWVTQHIICLGSSRRTHYLSSGLQIQIELLDSYQTYKSVVGVIHLAFLTKDKVPTRGFESYCAENAQITSNALRIIERSKPKWIATVSSGAVFSSPQGPLENNVRSNPYGFMKRVEETLLIDAAQKIGANISIGRLWAAMGMFMPINPGYAISDFILQSQESAEICIKAEGAVYRRYCSSSEFMRILVESAQEFEMTIFDSGGTLVEMSDLASYVAELTNSSVKFREISKEIAPNDYFPRGDQYEQIANSLGIDLTPLKQLISETLQGHLSQLEHRE